MLKDVFLHEVKQGASPLICDNYRLFHYGRRTVLVNEDDDSEQEFKSIDEAYENGVINGKKIKDIVTSKTYDDMFLMSLDDGGIQIK